jgi:quinol monooxygenase YgiN
MHAAIRRYQVDPSNVDEIMRHVDEGFLPIIKDAQGFLAYYALKAGDGQIATVSVFEDQAGAEESIRMAGDYVRDNLASLMPDPPEITAGEVSTHELNLIKLGIREVKQYAGRHKA